MRRRIGDDLPFDPDLGDPDRGSPDRGDPGNAQWAILAAVSLGGALGGMARYGVEWAIPVRDEGYPWGTFMVNVVGAFVLSIVLVLILEVWPPRRYLRPFIAIGFLGSFTTFSTWMLQVHDLAGAGRIGLAAAYLGGSLLAGLAAASMGLMVGRAMRIRRSGGRTEGRT